MLTRLLLSVALTSALPLFSVAHPDTLVVSANVRLPKDTVVKRQLLASLNKFLAHAAGDDTGISLVMPADMLEATALRDELRGLPKSAVYKDDNFYKAYLANATQTDDSTFLVQISYMGVHEGVPLCRAAFTLLAKKKGVDFYFCSPLRTQTRSWKSKKINGVTVHYREHINATNAKKYFNLIDKYDRKLGNQQQVTDYYCTDNFHDALKLLGIDYKADYNGYARNSLSADVGNGHLVVNGALTSEFVGFDPHDLWHARLHLVVPVTTINRPVDEGTAYLYGGSWGFSWEDILKKFKDYASANRDADWLALYNESKNFDEKGKYPLNVDFVINALIIEKIEREKGFASVIELMSCGKKQQDNSNYFTALKKITGISKENFNENVRALIKSD